MIFLVKTQLLLINLILKGFWKNPENNLDEQLFREKEYVRKYKISQRAL